MLDQQAGAEESFGSRLRTLREQAGLTQEELAERAGLTPHGVSALERGARTRPYPHTVRALAEALGVSEVERARLVRSVPSRRSRTGPVPPSRDGDAPRAASTAPCDEGPVDPPGLPVPPTPLFGRDDDVRAVVDLVRSGARLVTLTGPGGVGKTRLLVAVADALAGDHPDGTVQVALAPVLDPSGVAPAVGRSLGLAGVDTSDALRLVGAHLREQHLLLVLDNFEHLLAAAVDVGSLLVSCPRLTVLVSSRAPLRVRGEREHPVAPLGLPDPTTTTLEQLAASPAGALVLDRAAAVAPLALDDEEDVVALAGLCVRLAGIPLAIELATARLRLLGPATLLRRLDEVSLVAAGSRDLPARQRTMRATLYWSYGLLSPDEQTVLRVLGGFRASATLEALERVAGPEVPPGQVVGLLAALVEHSLVVVRPGPGGEHRFTMLEPVAQYARSLLVGEELGRVARAHAAHGAALAGRAAVGFEREEQEAWLAWVEADEADLVVAVERSLELGEPAPAARIVWGLWLYWWLRGQVSVGRRLAEQCLAADDAAAAAGASDVLDPGLRARVHLTAATMSFAGGDLDASAHHWERALALAARADDPEAACKATAGTGLAAMSSGRLDEADARFREALPLTELAGASGVWMRSLVHVWLGTVLMARDRMAEALEQVHLGLAIARSRGDRLSTYVALYGLARAAIAVGDHATARAHLHEGIRLSEQTQDMANLAYFLDLLAVVAGAEGDSRAVAVMLGAAQSLRESVGANVYGYYLPDDEARDAAERAARAALGDDAFDDALDAGRALEHGAVVGAVLRGEV